MASTASRSVACPIERAGAGALDFRIEPFTPELLPLVQAFSERYWSRPRTASYYTWRYVDSLPFSRTFLAIGGGECLGMVCAFRKPYLIDGERTHCLEVFDWHALPGLKGSGVGIRLMRAMMRTDDRTIAIGGTPDVLKTLPAMGWQQIGAATPFELPLTADVLRNGVRRRIAVPFPGTTLALKAAIRHWFRPRVRRGVERSAVRSVADGEVEPLYAGDPGYDFLQLPDPNILRWAGGGYPGNGSIAFLHFFVDDKLRGWIATRVYETEQGREAAILEVFAPRPDVPLYAWMISEAAVWLSGARPRLIRARATCPILAAALLANRFRAGLAMPIHTWPKGLSSRSSHVTLNHTDEPLRPYVPMPSARQPGID